MEQKPKDLFSDEELGGDADFFSQTAAQDVANEFSPGENDAFASADNRQAYGGDSRVQEVQESQARYEEGIPLVQSTEHHQKSPPIAHAAFEDDEGRRSGLFRSSQQVGSVLRSQAHPREEINVANYELSKLSASRTKEPRCARGGRRARYGELPSTKDTALQ